MTVLQFRNIHTNKVYTVVRFDREAGTVTMRGKFGEFTEKFDKERFQQMGYTLEQGEEDV